MIPLSSAVASVSVPPNPLPTDTLLVMTSAVRSPPSIDVCRLPADVTVAEVRAAIATIPAARMGAQDKRGLRARPVVLLAVPSGFAHPVGAIFRTTVAASLALGRPSGAVNSALVYARTNGRDTAKIQVGVRRMIEKNPLTGLDRPYEEYDYVELAWVDAGITTSERLGVPSRSVDELDAIREHVDTPEEIAEMNAYRDKINAEFEAKAGATKEGI